MRLFGNDLFEYEVDESDLFSIAGDMVDAYDDEVFADWISG